MAKERWKDAVTREYYQVDVEFVGEILPVGAVDGSSFGLIADATEYRLIREGEEVHIRPHIAELRAILNSIRRGGLKVSPEDAQRSVERFAELWEERIKEEGKWEELVREAEAAGEVGRPEERRREGVLGRLKAWLLGG